MSAKDWVMRHSDAFHDGRREDCEHCQEMIRIFGEMPSADEILAAARESIRQTKTPLEKRREQWQKKRHKIAPRILERDGYKCVMCGATEHLTIDHILPISKGGSDDDDNLRTLCFSDNAKKKDR